MKLYGTPGLGALTLSYSQDVKLREQTGEAFTKLANEIAALKKETAALKKTVAEGPSKNQIVFKSGSAKKGLDVI